MKRLFYENAAARRWVTSWPHDPRAGSFHVGLPGFSATALHDLPQLAADVGVGRLLVKHENERCGVPSFKLLGASWAVRLALAERLGAPGLPDDLDLLRGAVAADGPALLCATDGNHGRAVARMAALLGLDATVLVPRTIEPAYRRAIQDEGAQVVDIDGTYDEAVSESARLASLDERYLLVSDTAWPGYERVPRWVSDGYSSMLAEVDEQLAGASVDLVAVPVGVGSLALAVVEHFRRGQMAPSLLAVEPAQAACLGASLQAGAPTQVGGALDSVMGGLNCGAVSALAWPSLLAGVDRSITVHDSEALRAVHDLAQAGVSTGPSGAAALAGLRALVDEGLLPDAPSATALLLVTEGITAAP